MRYGDLVTSCFPNVVAAAGRFCARHPRVNNSDAVSAGTEALIDGAMRYRPDRPVVGPAGLWHFVKLRVVGSMLDMERKDRGLDRNNGKPRLLSLDSTKRNDAFTTLDHHPDPFIVQSLGILTPKERELIRLVYWEGETASDAAVRMGLSLSRGPQIHREALRKLREWLA